MKKEISTSEKIHDLEVLRKRFGWSHPMLKAMIDFSRDIHLLESSPLKFQEQQRLLKLKETIQQALSSLNEIVKGPIWYKSKVPYALLPRSILKKHLPPSVLKNRQRVNEIIKKSYAEKTVEPRRYSRLDMKSELRLYLKSIERDLTTRIPLDLTPGQWATWNLAPFFRHKRSRLHPGTIAWEDLEMFFKIATAWHRSADAIRKEYRRLQEGDPPPPLPPLDMAIAPYLDTYRQHRSRSILTIAHDETFKRLHWKSPRKRQKLRCH